jgi:hypothetical protein
VTSFTEAGATVYVNSMFVPATLVRVAFFALSVFGIMTVESLLLDTPSVNVASAKLDAVIARTIIADIKSTAILLRDLVMIFVPFFLINKFFQRTMPFAAWFHDSLELPWGQKKNTSSSTFF